MERIGNSYRIISNKDEIFFKGMVCENLLLDEPTSNLDSLNEAVILKALKEEAKGKTVVLVSHCKSTVRNADEIIGFEKKSPVDATL